VTSVTEEGGVRTLLTNGKFQGNTGWEMNAQRFLAHYPSLFVKHFDRALIIGLGTGTTLGAVAAYPWKGIDLVEISPSIVEAAARFFPHTNGAVLTDPRVQVHPDDGRNFLLVRPAGDYDLIGIELSSIWFAGASNLYSAEFYELARKHLKPDGIFQQWVQLHHIYLRDFATVLHTLRAHFRHTALFYGGGQGVIIGAEQPLTVSMEQLSRLTNPKLRALIPNGRDLQSLLDDMLLLDEGLDRFLDFAAAKSGVSAASLVSSDDNLYLEYATPKGNALSWDERTAMLAEIRRFRDAQAIGALVRADGG
jgi:spermidine synthase